MQHTINGSIIEQNPFFNIINFWNWTKHIWCCLYARQSTLHSVRSPPQASQVANVTINLCALALYIVVVVYIKLYYPHSYYCYYHHYYFFVIIYTLASLWVDAVIVVIIAIIFDVPGWSVNNILCSIFVQFINNNNNNNSIECVDTKNNENIFPKEDWRLVERRTLDVGWRNRFCPIQKWEKHSESPLSHNHWAEIHSVNTGSCRARTGAALVKNILHMEGSSLKLLQFFVIFMIFF